jgi:hypothetical protein
MQEMTGQNLKLKYRAPKPKGSNPARAGGNSGASRSKPVRTKEQVAAAHEATRVNQRVMVLVDGRHRRFMTVAEWERMAEERT